VVQKTNHQNREKPHATKTFFKMNTDNNQSTAYSPHDPRLTAYALGEMDADARAAYEAEIRDNPAAQTAIAEIRALAAELETALAHEPVSETPAARAAGPSLATPAPEPDWRAAREAEAARARRATEKNDPYAKRVWRFPYFLVAGLALACFAVIFFLARTPYSERTSMAKAPTQIAATVADATNATTVINGHTYQAIDLGTAVTLGESASATTTAPETILSGSVATTLALAVPKLEEERKHAWDEGIIAASTPAAPASLVTANGVISIGSAGKPLEKDKEAIAIGAGSLALGNSAAQNTSALGYGAAQSAVGSNINGIGASAYALQAGAANASGAPVQNAITADNSIALGANSTAAVIDATAPDAVAGEVVQMSVFNVTAERDNGYQAVNTTSGARITTALKTPTVSIQPFSDDFLNDVGATTVENIHAYSANVESESSGDGTVTGGALVGNANSRTRSMPSAAPSGAPTPPPPASAPDANTEILRKRAYNNASVNIGEAQVVVAFTAGSPRATPGTSLTPVGFTNNTIATDAAGTVATTTVDFQAGSPRALSYPGGETYPVRPANPFLLAAQTPLSTFSADVDTASYTNIRRFLNNGQRPPPDAVRIEEMLNYFTYDYAPPPKTTAAPFAPTMEVAAAPWNPAHRLVRIGIKGRDLDAITRPIANLVFLIDVSGSMDRANKLPLVKESMRMLLGKLRPDDRIAIVTYADGTSLALASTPVSHKTEILAVLDSLQARGSTNGGAGIQLAYDIAKANYIDGGANRVILCTDGDFNVGVTNPDALVTLITDKAKTGVYLSVLGFGMGNYKDATLQRLADKGNGNYGYIDTREEARRQLVDRTDALVNTIAKDVKLQVEFNPAQVAAYRLIGYEKRALAAQDFNNDKVDAGEIGAGHTVTALYEIIPANERNGSGEDESGGSFQLPSEGAGSSPHSPPPIDALKYQTQTIVTVTTTPKPEAADELLTLKIRYKLPTSDTSDKIEYTLKDTGATFAAASADFKFASAVAAFGIYLRNTTDSAAITPDNILTWGEPSTGEDPTGQRAEFFDLVRRARQM